MSGMLGIGSLTRSYKDYSEKLVGAQKVAITGKKPDLNASEFALLGTTDSNSAMSEVAVGLMNRSIGGLRAASSAVSNMLGAADEIIALTAEIASGVLSAEEVANNEARVKTLLTDQFSSLLGFQYLGSKVFSNLKAQITTSSGNIVPDILVGGKTIATDPDIMLVVDTTATPAVVKVDVSNAAKAKTSIPLIQKFQSKLVQYGSAITAKIDNMEQAIRLETNQAEASNNALEEVMGVDPAKAAAELNESRLKIQEAALILRSAIDTRAETTGILYR